HCPKNSGTNRLHQIPGCQAPGEADCCFVRNIKIEAQQKSGNTSCGNSNELQARQGTKVSPTLAQKRRCMGVKIFEETHDVCTRLSTWILPTAPFCNGRLVPPDAVRIFAPMPDA